MPLVRAPLLGEAQGLEWPIHVPTEMAFDLPPAREGAIDRGRRFSVGVATTNLGADAPPQRASVLNGAPKHQHWTCCGAAFAGCQYHSAVT